MKHIYVITDVDLLEKSAQPIHVLSLCKYLGRLGVKVHLICPFWQSGVLQVPQEVITVPVSVPKQPFLRARIFQTRLLILLSRLPRPDALYVRLSAGMISPAVWTYLTGVPLFVEVNGIIEIEYLMQVKAPNIKKWLKVQRMRAFEYLNLKRAKGIIFVTNQLREYFASRYQIPPEKSVVINNGVDLEIFKPGDKQQSRRELGVPDGQILLGFVGALAPWQGLEDAIRAVRLLRDRGTNCQLFIVGQGVEENRLRTLIQELGVSAEVTLVGGVDYESVPFYINAFDICLVPKRNLLSGVSPLKLYEYMACGRPIVATDVPGLEIVSQIGAGVNAKAGSPESLADAIEELIRRKGEWEEMGLRGRMYVEMNASWKRRAEETILFFKDQLGGIWS